MIALIPVIANAEIFPKTGTASLQFLKLGIDARATGMGEAYTAISDDISSVYWNPAGLAKKMDNQFMFSHTKYVAGISHEFVAASRSLDWGNVAVFLNYLHMDDMKVTTEDEFDWTGEYFTSYDLAAGVTYANAFTDKFNFGVSAKYITEKIEEYSVSTMSVDLGSTYNTGWNNLTIGMSLRNFGPDIKYEVDWDEDGSLDEDPYDLFDNDGDGLIDEDREEMAFKIPMNYSMGLSADLYRTKTSSLIGAFQIDNCVDRAETWNLGCEYNWNNFSLRSGYQLNYDEAGFAAGFGVRIPTRISILNVDLSWTDFGDLSESFIESPIRLSIKATY